MRLLLRCDSGGHTGVGHAVRCQALADAARARGHDVVWSGTLHDVGWLLDISAALPPEDEPTRLAALAREVDADAVHVDHYGLSSGLRQRLGATGIVLSNVEDFENGRRPADVVVDPNIGAQRFARADDGSPTVLRGLDYTLLRIAVLQARADRAAGPRAHEGLRVLLVMGGTDAAALLDPLLNALDQTAIPADVDVIVPAGRHIVPKTNRWLRLQPSPPRPDLPGMMAQSDLVISAAGTTVWELCCIGVPMALACAADNQAGGYAAVIESGAAAGLGGPQQVRDIARTAAILRSLLADTEAREPLGRRAGALVDGGGASRVVTAIEEARGGGESDLRVRAANPADAALLHEWRNDETTRQWSRSSDRVPWADHVQWLDSSLARDDRLLLIVEHATRGSVGTVRCDRDEDGGWEVSITVAPQERGCGLATEILCVGERALTSRNGPGITARAVVHEHNIASKRLFRRAGYVPTGSVDADGFALYRKTLA